MICIHNHQSKVIVFECEAKLSLYGCMSFVFFYVTSFKITEKKFDSIQFQYDINVYAFKSFTMQSVMHKNESNKQKKLNIKQKSTENGKFSSNDHQNFVLRCVNFCY